MNKHGSSRFASYLALCILFLTASQTTAKALNVSSGQGLAAAFTDPEVDTVFLTSDLVLQEDDWKGLNVPVLRLGNITIRGHASPDNPELWPLLDMGFVAQKVVLGNRTALTFEAVILQNYRSGNPYLQVGIELFQPCPPQASAYMLVTHAIIFYDLCFPPNFTDSPLRKAPRPPIYPGTNQFSLDVAQTDCIPVQVPNVVTADTQGVPLAQRCWARKGFYDDIGLFGVDIDPTTKLQVATGHLLHITDTIYLCKQVVPEECMRQLGMWPCFNACLNGSCPSLLPPLPPLSPPLPPPPLPPQARVQSSPADSIPTGAIVGGVLGGVVACAVIATAIALVLVARRRGTPKCPQFGCLSHGVASQPPRAALEAPSQLPNGFNDRPKSASSVLVMESGGFAKHSAEGAGDMSYDRKIVDSQSLGTGRLDQSVSTADSQLANTFVVSPLTPPRADVQLAIDPRHEVKLLPLVLGRGAFGKVVEGEYQGQRVAVKVLLDVSVHGWGLSGPATRAAAASGRVELGGAGAAQAQGEVALPPSPVTPTSAVHPAALVPSQPLFSGGGTMGGLAGVALYHSSTGDNCRDGRGQPAADGRWRGPQGASGSSSTGHLHLDAIRQEVEVLGRCEHPNIVRLLAACLTPPRVCLVMELMEMSLQKLLASTQRGQRLPLRMILDIAFDVAKGLEYLHPSIVHRDLKPGNVLLSLSSGTRVVAKLSDFGLSRLRFETMVTEHPEAGTPAYVAPELYSTESVTVSHRADIYSYGVLLWTMLTGLQPWQGVNVVQLAVRVALLNERLPISAIPEGYAFPRLVQLVQMCWEADPMRRPAAEEIIKELVTANEELTAAGAL